MLPKAVVATEGLVGCGEPCCTECHIKGIWGKAENRQRKALKPAEPW